MLSVIFAEKKQRKREKARERDLYALLEVRVYAASYLIGQLNVDLRNNDAVALPAAAAGWRWRTFTGRWPFALLLRARNVVLRHRTNSVCRRSHWQGDDDCSFAGWCCDGRSTYINVAFCYLVTLIQAEESVVFRLQYCNIFQRSGQKPRKPDTQGMFWHRGDGTVVWCGLCRWSDIFGRLWSKVSKVLEHPTLDNVELFITRSRRSGFLPWWRHVFELDVGCFLIVVDSGSAVLHGDAVLRH